MGGRGREGEGDRRMRKGEEGEERSAMLTIQKRNIRMCTFTNECASTACVHTCTQVSMSGCQLPLQTFEMRTNTTGRLCCRNPMSTTF